MTAHEIDDPDFAYPDHARGGTVLAFDRDYTVDVNPHPHPDKPAVPLSWVRHLAHETGHVVFATGNQTLKSEAEIPGVAEIVHGHPEVDPETIRSDAFGGTVSRRRRIRYLGECYPDAETCIVVDDVDVSDVAGWTHYFPWAFVEAVRAGEVLAGMDLPDAGGE